LTGNGRSQLTPGSLSASGRFVAFESQAANLTANDTNGTSDVFVRDLITGSNLLASANPDGSGSMRGPSRNAILSGDGRWAAFETIVEPPSGLNNRFTLIARDLAQGTNLSVAPVSASPYPSAPANPSWSADARYLAFRSSAPGIVPGVTGSQIYFRDLAQATNVLVTRNLSGTAGGSGPSWTPWISSNGAQVFFLSTAANLVTNTVSGTNLYLWDALSQQSRLLSVSNNGGAFGQVLAPAIAPSGDFAILLNRTNLYFWSLTQAVPALVVSNASAASLSANGRFIALESSSKLTPQDTNASPDIFLYDRLSNNFALVSVNAGATGSGNGRSRTPLITPDSHFVLFASQATNLVTGDTNAFTDLLLRDLSAGTTMLVSRNYSSTGSADSLSVNPVISPDGQLVVFESYASDLAAGDFNQTKDLFALRISGGDSDGDGMADDFELAYFGDLSRDGSGDFDGDGQSDLTEYGAGTNPADQLSLFRAFTLSNLNSANGVTVLWSAIPGRPYRVQYKEGLEQQSWTDLAGDVVATSSTGVKVDSTASTAAQRFYRIMALPW
jgi:Tol biopolymer transport system component